MIDWGSLREHEDYSVWCYDFSMGFAIEIAADEARRVLPPGLHPFEIRPGVSLLTMNTLSFTEGNHRFDRAFREVTFSLNVVPNLFLAGRLPKFAVYVLNVGVTDLGFAQDPYNTDRLPFYPRAIEVELDPVVRSVRCRDALGPIFELHDISRQAEFARKEDFFQVFAKSEDGGLLHGAMTLEAESFEHQVSGACGVIHDHPIFAGLRAAQPKAENYMQLFTQEGALGVQHYYRLKPF